MTTLLAPCDLSHISGMDSGLALAKDLYVILGCDLSHIKLPLALCGVSHISGMIQPVLPYYWNTSASQAGGPTPPDD